MEFGIPLALRLFISRGYVPSPLTNLVWHVMIFYGMCEHSCVYAVMMFVAKCVVRMSLCVAKDEIL